MSASHYCNRLFKITVLLFFGLLPLACLQQNEDTGVTGSSITSALSFQYATSEQINSSYLLRVDGWEETLDGVNIFKHLVDDEYFGLEGVTSGAPIQDLAFQLSKSTSEFKNFLGFEGIFNAQNLSINLPRSIFFSGLNLTQDLSAVDLSKFTYFYRMANSDIEVEADFTIDNVTKKVTIVVNEPGSIIVRPIAVVANQNNNETAGSNNTFHITAPNLQFKHYHDQDASLRTFSWSNSNAVANCSLDGGTTYTPCSSPTTLVLSVADFNLHPNIKVQIPVASGTLVGELDLSDPDNGFSETKFYTCSIPMVPGDLNGLTLPSPNEVVCLAPGAYHNSGGSLDLNSFPDTVIIGDHLNKPIINTSSTAINGAQSSMASHIVIANLTINLSGSTSEAIYFNNSLFAEPNNSENIVSNVEINILSGSSLIGIYAGPGQNTYILDTKIDSSVSVSTGIVVKGPWVKVLRSEIEMQSGAYYAISFQGSTAPGKTSYIDHSQLSNANATYSPIYISTFGGAISEPSNLAITNSKIITNKNGINLFNSSPTIHIENSIIVKRNIFATTAFGFNTNSNVSYNLSGFGNIFCAEEPAAAGVNKFSGVINNGGAGGNSTVGDFEIPATYDGACPP